MSALLNWLGALDVFRRARPAAPRRVPLEAVHSGQALADFAADRCYGSVDSGIQFVAARLVLTVEDLIHHGDHHFFVFSKRDRETGAVVGGRAKRSFDERDPAFRV